MPLPEIIRKTHFVAVTLFFLIYLVKTILLLANKKEQLASLTKKTRVIEMIVSFLSLATGIWLMIYVDIGAMLILKITLVFLSIPLAIIGFKRGNKAMATISFLLILAAFGMGEMSKNKKAVVGDVKGADGSIDGRTLYVNNCVTCHGANGKNGIPGAPDLSATQLSPDSIASIVMNGRNTMGRIDGLSKEHAMAIATYVNDSLKGK